MSPIWFQNAYWGLFASALARDYDSYIAWLIWLSERLNRHLDSTHIQGDYENNLNNIIIPYCDAVSFMFDPTKVKGSQVNPIPQVYKRCKGYKDEYLR